MSSRFSFKQFLLFIAVFLVGVVTPLYLNRSVPSSSEKMAVSYNQKAFFEEIAPTVQKVAKSYGVSPSIILAQAALESDYGSNLLAVKYHNLFAIKAQSGQKSVKLTYQTYFLNKWQTKEGRFGQMPFMIIVTYCNQANCTIAKVLMIFWYLIKVIKSLLKPCKTLDLVATLIMPQN